MAVLIGRTIEVFVYIVHNGGGGKDSGPAHAHAWKDTHTHTHTHIHIGKHIYTPTLISDLSLLLFTIAYINLYYRVYLSLREVHTLDSITLTKMEDNSLKPQIAFL